MQVTREEKEKSRVTARNHTEAAIACRQFTSGGTSYAANGVMRNYSEEGCYIETSHEFNLGTILHLRIVHYPPCPPSLAVEELPRSICLAKIKWQQVLVGENTIQYGFGLRYLD